MNKEGFLVASVVDKGRMKAWYFDNGKQQERVADSDNFVNNTAITSMCLKFI